MVRNPVAHPKEKTISLRVSNSERDEMERNAIRLGFKSVSDYLRHLHKESFKATSPEPTRTGFGDLPVFHKTSLGVMYNGDSLDFMHNPKNKGKVNLVMTSPPFGLVRKKSYGNEDAHAYCEWFRPFAEGFNNVLA